MPTNRTARPPRGPRPTGRRGRIASAYETYSCIQNHASSTVSPGAAPAPPHRLRGERSANRRRAILRDDGRGSVLRDRAPRLRRGHLPRRAGRLRPLVGVRPVGPDHARADRGPRCRASGAARRAGRAGRGPRARRMAGRLTRGRGGPARGRRPDPVSYRTDRPGLRRLVRGWRVVRTSSGGAPASRRAAALLRDGPRSVARLGRLRSISDHDRTAGMTLPPEVDVLVVGFGAAAASTAHEAGASVAVVEKTSAGGGNCVHSGGFLFDLDGPHAVEHLDALCFGKTDRAVLETYARGLPEVPAFLEALGGTAEPVDEDA